MFTEGREKTTDDTDLKFALARAAHRYPRDFAFYVTDPSSSIRG
jgi:hypothetical protein